MRAMDAAPTGSASVADTEVAPHSTDPNGPDQTRGAVEADGAGEGSGGQPRHRHSAGGGGGSSPVATRDAEGEPYTQRTKVLIVVATVIVIAASLALRFWTKSDMWLDEALTVNIAGRPLHEIPSYLKRDGAPPLYYVLLHFWMGWFGHSDVGIRSLSGVFGVVTIPLAWLAGKRLGGKTVGWAAMLLVASSPFAIRYDTENRMYALVVLLTVLGFLALDGALRRPRAGNLIGLAIVTGLLLYTHYWSLYLIGTMLVWLVFQIVWGRPEWRRGAKASLIAGLIGCLAFVPWLPTFLYQSKHTGTPWATPANFAAMVNAVSSFAGGGTNQGRALGLIFFALAGLGLFGLATGRSHIDLDIRTRPLGRPLAIAVVGTLAAAITGGLVTNSAFDARYASVVFIPLILLVAIGLLAFLDRRVRAVILSVAVIAGLASSIPNVTTNRTQAGQVARAIAATGRPGDIVAYCPDQLGPAVDRLLPAGRYEQTTFPRGTGPAFINWVDYGAAVHRASPLAFAQKLEAEAASAGRQIYLVWASGYQTYGVKCEGIVQTLQANPAYHATEVVVGNDNSFFQPMWMVRFTPTAS
jgi:mannosyltransferase